MPPAIRSVLQRLAHRFRRAFHRAEFERQLDNELRFHIESEAAELVKLGVAPQEARRRAIAALGGVERWREEARATRVSSALETLAHDARLAVRSLARSPSHTVPVVLTLALGIATMASIASVAYDVLVRPLPYRDPSRLVAVFERNIPRKRDRNVVSAVAFEAWRQRSHTLDSVSALMPVSGVWLTDQGPEQISGAKVTPSFFELLGRRPVFGSGFSSPTPGSEVVVSYEFWTRRLNSDSLIIGKSIRLDGRAVTVMGVMPRDFLPLRFGWMGEQEYWLPLVLGPQHREWGRFLLVVARLGHGATLAAAEREVRAIHAQLRAEGTIAEGWDAQVIALPEEISGSVRGPFLALLVACGLLLVMVLTNTSLLTIAHARRRAADRVLRSVLGATRGRLLAERLVTTVLLAGGGALLGAFLAQWAIPELTRVLPRDVPRLSNVHFGGVALLVAAGVGALAALVLALIPLRDRRRTDLQAMLHGDRLTHGRRTAWVVMGEAAAAVVLTLFAGLTLRSFDRLSHVNVGFDPSHLMAFRVGFDAPGRSNDAAVAASRAFLQRMREMPGVVSAGRTSVRPLYSGGSATTVTPRGLGDKDRSAFPTADVRFVDLGYFRTLGLTAMKGRLFSAGDGAGAPMRVVVNETFGARLWPGESADVVGRSFDLRLNGSPSPEIIGVVRDVRLWNPRVEPRPTVYIFTEQQSVGEEYDVVVRTSTDEAALLPQIRAAVRAVSSETPIFRIESMRQTVDETIARERVTAQLLVLFAAAALVLVAVGVYGLYAGEVTARRREIGVRMALGETSRGVVQSLLAGTLVRAGAGVGAGAAMGFLASRLLQTTLYGIARTDPLSYVLAVAIVILTALGATLLPALQASAVAPSEALRSE